MVSDCFFRRVSEDPLGTIVPALDDPLQRFADDGVVGRFDDGRQHSGRQKLTRLVSLCAPLRGDVAKDQDTSGYLSKFISDRGGTVVDRTLGTVTADEECMIRQSDDDSFAKRFRREGASQPNDEPARQR